MISRIPLRCLACQRAVTLRAQVGHESTQPVVAICPECFTPFRLRLLLDNPPHVGIEFVENCEASAEEGVVVNVGVGFVISRDRMHDGMYFPAMDLPQPDEATLQGIQAKRPAGAEGPIAIDLTVLLGGLPRSQDHWRFVRNAYRFSRNGQDDRMRAQLRESFGHDIPDADLTIERALLSFLVRFLAPNGDDKLLRVMAEFARAGAANQHEFDHLRNEFRASRWERMDEYMDVFNSFFRSYEEFNQTLIYVRRGIELPDNPYAPSTDFENTKLYYGEAFEVLGSHIDLLAAINNVTLGRSFDQLSQISLRTYRTSNKGRRNETLVANPELAWLVAEYDNRIRNASHHRWFRLSHDRSNLSYREGGNGEVRMLSYADYLYKCCAITAQLMLLASVEIMTLSHHGAA